MSSESYSRRRHNVPVTHIIPIDDLRDHTCDLDCWCDPEVEDRDPETGELYSNGLLVRHNAADHREEREADGELDPDKGWERVTIE